MTLVFTGIELYNVFLHLQVSSTTRSELVTSKVGYREVAKVTPGISI